MATLPYRFHCSFGQHNIAERGMPSTSSAELTKAMLHESSTCVTLEPREGSHRATLCGCFLKHALADPEQDAPAQRLLRQPHGSSQLRRMPRWPLLRKHTHQASRDFRREARTGRAYAAPPASVPWLPPAQPHATLAKSGWEPQSTFWVPTIRVRSTGRHIRQRVI